LVNFLLVDIRHLVAGYIGLLIWVSTETGEDQNERFGDLVVKGKGKVSVETLGQLVSRISWHASHDDFYFRPNEENPEPPTVHRENLKLAESVIENAITRAMAGVDLKETREFFASVPRGGNFG